MNDDAIIDAVLKAEGGFVDLVADKGGPTNFGVTMATLSEWRGHQVTPSDVRALTQDEAREIYRKRYIEEPGFGALASPELRAIVVDCGVLHGPRNAIRMLQRALQAKEDGTLGPVTITAANAWHGPRLARRVLADRLRFFGRLISKDLTDRDKDGIPDNTEFASGWLNRCAHLLEELG